MSLNNANFRVGDRVRVSNPGTTYHGEEGCVIGFCLGYFNIKVNFKTKACSVDFSEPELELIINKEVMFDESEE